MKMIFKNSKMFQNGTFVSTDAFFDGKVFSLGLPSSFAEEYTVYDNCFILPGFCDVHVHFREPGFSYKEDIESGSNAAARGGYTCVCTMPNLNPTPDSREHLDIQLDAINEKAKIKVVPFGTITKLEAGLELSDMDEIAADVAGFSDDGKGVQDEDMMLAAMKKASSLGKLISAHCEDNSLLRGGYIHDGEYARIHGHRGICSESEWGPIKRDIELVKKSGCSYHVCHISTKESVDIIRRAKSEGVDISCETGPHYLVMNDMMLEEEGRFKMNPPIRSEEDRKALVEGILDGTIEMIATDHAPHSAEEKSKGLEKSLMGVVGLETAFPILYTELVMKDIISLEALVELLAINPRKRFGLDGDMGITVFECNTPYEIDSSEFVSRGKSSPFLGRTVYGRNLLTVYDSKIAYIAE